MTFQDFADLKAVDSFVSSVVVPDQIVKADWM